MAPDHLETRLARRACFPFVSSAMVTRRMVLKACNTFVAGVSLWAAGSRGSQAVSARRLKWVAFYGGHADETVLASYDTVILDPMFEGSVAAIGRAGASVCAYLSLGEISTSGPFFDRVDRSALLEENPAWPGTRRIDVRRGSWRDLVINEMIPSIAAKGFTGLMLDTLDTPPYLEKSDPATNRGMQQAAVDLVRAIRTSYPAMTVIMNRGYALLPSVVGCIDGIIAESLLTRPDEHKVGSYRWNDPSQVDLVLSLLAPALHRTAGLPILSLDYWDPDDNQTIEKIYRRHRQLGHHPYVATPMLDTIIPEPVL